MAAISLAQLMQTVRRGVFSLPAPLVDAVMKIAGPGSPLFPLVTRSQGYKSTPIPDPVDIPTQETRVLIGPANFAEQAWQWARAINRNLDQAGARNMMVAAPGRFAFRADSVVSYGAFAMSKQWAQRFFDEACQFTHVLVEAEQPLFGPLFHFDVEQEVHALQDRGVRVALMSHGSDTRNPRTHRLNFDTSPFDARNRETQLLQRRADRNRALIERLSLPTFVSTPDLLDDLPNAHWCPLVVDADEWDKVPRRKTVAAQEDEPGAVRVAHIPSRSWLKGTEFIEPVLDELHAEHIIDSRLIYSVPRDEMPSVLAEVDVLVEQLTMGVYGTTSLEAIAAGCIAVAHVDTRMRSLIHSLTGQSAPVVEATPDSLREVLVGLSEDPDERARIRAAGTDYLETVHSGKLSAQVLNKYWLAANG